MTKITEQGTLRITVYNGGSTVKILDCANAGKRGKVCPEVVIQVWAAGQREHGQLCCDLVHNMPVTLVDLNSWELVLKFISYARTLASASNQVNIYESEIKSVRVAPLGFQPVSVGNANYSAGASFDDFGAADHTDQANFPKWISTSKQRKSDFAKVYAFIRDNQEILNDPAVTFHKFLDLVGKATGVVGHYYYMD